MPCDGEGGDGGDASASQEKLKIARKPPDTNREAWGESPHNTHKEPAQPTPRLGLLASDCETRNFCG